MSTVLPSPRVCNTTECQAARGQARVSRPYPVVTGVDKLEITAHLICRDYSIFDTFSELKQEVQKGMKPAVPVTFGDKEYFKWNLQRAGTRLFSYVLKAGDVTLMLSPRSPESKIPNCQVEIGSVSSQEGAFEIYRHLLSWLGDYGFVPIKQTVSRVDLSADFVGVKLSDLSVDDQEVWISKGRDFNIYTRYRKLTGIHFGSSRLMMRIYDKGGEVKNNAAKSKYFHRLWDCPPGTPVVRVEFQIRRVVLKEFQIKVDTPRELELQLDTIWQYLTQNWIRQAEKKVDRDNKNHKQAKTSEFWQKVQNTIFRCSSPTNWRLIKKNLHKNLKFLKDQARGCILSVAAAAGHDPGDFDGIIATCADVISEELGHFMHSRAKEFKKLFEVRLNECYVGF